MNRTFDPGPLAQAEYHASDDDRWTLTFVRELRHPPEKVWAALTEPAQLNEWAPYAADRDLGRPGAATLTMIDGGEAVDLAATVYRADRPSLLEYSWGGDRLRWELAPTATGTRLTLRHTLADQAWLPKVAAGWHLCLVVAEHLLDGEPIAPIRGEGARRYGWEQLREGYAGRLGIEATQ